MHKFAFILLIVSVAGTGIFLSRIVYQAFTNYHVLNLQGE